MNVVCCSVDLVPDAGVAIGGVVQQQSDQMLVGSPYEIVSGNKLVYNAPPVTGGKRDARESTVDTTAAPCTDTDSKYSAISSERLKRSALNYSCDESSAESAAFCNK